MNADAPAWHHRPASEALAEFGVAADRGLSAQRAAEAFRRHGPNELPRAERDPAWKVFLRQFLSPLVLVLLAAAAIATAAATWHADPAAGVLVRYSDAIAVLLIVLLNAVIGFVQERRAERALESLQAMLSFNARVLRDGVERVVGAREVVPGDVVVMEAGDHVPADVRLVVAFDFRADESMLTGESVPVEKDAGAAVGADAPAAERPTMAFMGTMAVRGRAVGVAAATGVGTEIGRIGKLMGAIASEPSPLERRLARFSRAILAACLAIAAAFFALALGTGDWPVWTLLMTAVSLAVAAIPEGLPAVTTITLALGMQRMARRGALIRRLPAVETLGSAQVICTDKTGTLTLNDMQVREVATLGMSCRVVGGQDVGEGRLLHAGAPVTLDADSDMDALVRAAVVPNHVTYRAEDDGRIRWEGDPTEVAIVAFGARMGVLRRSAIEGLDLVATNPFDSDRRRMSLVYRAPGSDAAVSYVKGSADEILGRCDAVLSGGRTCAMTDDDRRIVAERAHAMAVQALRVLAIARKTGLDPAAPDGAETGLEFLGLVGMQDPPRPEALEAIRTCKEAGVRVAMITGDHAATAGAVAREMEMWEDGDEIVTGAQLQVMPEDDLARRVDKVRVFARVTPEQKLRIVRAWKARGAVVAMTGDGVNDAPALREADIGVAMGKGGTDVAREASEMVLTDNSFASIVAAVIEGRTILANIRKSIVFLLSSNIGLVLAVFAAIIFPDLLPLAPLQILWINLVTNGAPALGLGVDPPEPGHALAGPRPVGAGLLDRADLAFMFVFGGLMGAAAIALYLLPSGVPGGGDAATARTVVFGFLAFVPLFHAFNCRGRRESLLSRRWAPNVPLRLALLASAALQLLAMLAPPLQPVFRTVPLPLGAWLVVLGASFAVVPIWEGWKLIRRLQDR